MLNRFVLHTGLRNFAQSRHSRMVSFISVLAIAGLVLGVALLVTVMSVMNGFDREMRTRILGQIPHIKIFDQSGPLHNWQGLGEQLFEHPSVLAVEPYVELEGLLSVGGKVVPVNFEGLRLVPGGRAEHLLGSDALKDGSGVYLAQGVASQLGVKTGDLVTFIVPDVAANTERESSRQGMAGSAFVVRALHISGVFRTGTALDHMLVVAGLEHTADMAGIPGQVHGLQISIDNVLKVRETGYALLRSLPVRLSFNDWLQTHGHLYQAINMSRNLVSLLVFLVIGLAVFNVVSMLVMTVVDKKRAVAIYKTLGATSREVLGVFIVQGMLIGLTGIVLGELLGVLITFNLDTMVSLLESLLGRQLLSSEVYPVDFLPVMLQWQDLLVIAGVALFLNLLATLYPAWKASGTLPAQVLSED